MEEIVNLNVGGQIFSTYKTNLTRKEEFEPNFFQQIFKSEQKIPTDEHGNIFIDRDPTYFRYILNYLRNFGDVDKCIFPEGETELKELIEETKFYKLKKFTDFLEERNYVFLGSHILNLQLSSLLTSFFPNKKWKLIFRATRDGFDPLSFHSSCDGKGPTVVLIETSNGYVFGGYTSKSWRDHGGFFKDEDCFLFSISTPTKQQAIKFELSNEQSSDYAVYHSIDKGPCFGTDALHCVDNRVFTHLGETFKCDQEFGLCGKFSTSISEIEVFIENKK